MYCGVEKRFCLPHFTFFLELVEDYNDALFLTWWIEHTTHIQYVAFYFGGKLYMLHATNSTTRIVSMETKEIVFEVVNFLKAQCSSVAIHLISVGEVFSSTWVTTCHWCNLSLGLVRFRSKGKHVPNGNHSIPLWVLQSLWEPYPNCEGIVKPYSPWLTIFFLQIDNANSCQLAMSPPHDCHPILHLWERLRSSRILITTSLSGLSWSSSTWLWCWVAWRMSALSSTLHTWR